MHQSSSAGRDGQEGANKGSGIRPRPLVPAKGSPSPLPDRSGRTARKTESLPGRPGRAPGGPDLQPNRVEVARVGDVILFRVIGLGTVNTAGPLWDFAEHAMADGCLRFAFDLAACRGLDSTFMGMMVGISQGVRERGGDRAWACALNVSEANLGLLRIVGADRFLRFKSHLRMEPIETEPLVLESFSPERRIELVRRAHENLLAIDRRNEERFGDFLRCLAAELSGTAGGTALDRADS